MNTTKNRRCRRRRTEMKSNTRQTKNTLDTVMFPAKSVQSIVCLDFGMLSSFVCVPLDLECVRTSTSTTTECRILSIHLPPEWMYAYVCVCVCSARDSRWSSYHFWAWSTSSDEHVNARMQACNHLHWITECAKGDQVMNTRDNDITIQMTNRIFNSLEWNSRQETETCFKIMECSSDEISWDEFRYSTSHILPRHLKPLGHIHIFDSFFASRNLKLQFIFQVDSPDLLCSRLNFNIVRQKPTPHLTW